MHARFAAGRRPALVFVIVVSVLAALVLGVVGFFAWTGVMGDHFAVVDPGRFYRSGKMDGEALRRVVTQNGIRSVVNLCGKQSGKDWYDAEIALCKDLGIAHQDIRISPGEAPARSTLRDLIAAFDTGPYPMLMHCGGGADRAGFASALYEIVVRGEDERRAVATQMTWQNGHLPFLGFEQLDRFFEIARGRPAGEDFRTFVLNRYEADS